MYLKITYSLRSFLINTVITTSDFPLSFTIMESVLRKQIDNDEFMD